MILHQVVVLVSTEPNKPVDVRAFETNKLKEGWLWFENGGADGKQRGHYNEYIVTIMNETPVSW